jgi:N utilization substance protein A
MKSEFILAFNQICSERGLPPEIVMEALGTALVTAFRRDTNISSAQNVTVEIDQDSGQAAIFIEKEVVEHVQNEGTEVQLKDARKIDPNVQLGDTIMVENTPGDFGRIAAQTAKQVILQRIREAEREALYEDYAGREGEIINGVIQSITHQHISINLGRTEAILPRKEQVRSDNYTLHQRLRAYVVEVRRSGRGPQIIVSRSHKNMLRRLLELEVPEIYNGAVEIKAIAREAGARSKVAVAARQPGIDPVGSCVGMRGVRIQSIVSELGGEKIDVIEWSPDPPVFIAKALSPARVLTVHLEESPEDGRTATVIVPDDQLSLAIGREGQNARLAAKLTSWRIDIKGVTEAAQEVLKMTADEQVRADLGNIAQLLPTVAALLQYRNETNNDYNTEQQLLLRQVIDQVYNYFAAKRRAARESLLEKAPHRVAIETVGAQRRAAREEALAQIPDNAYDIPLEALALSSRVHNHLAKARIENLGQIMERMASGDEGLLALDGIGPKALAEIKTQVEEVAPPMPEEPPAEAVAVAEPEAAPEEVLEDAEEAIAPEAAPEIVAEAEVEMPEAIQPPAAPPEPDLRAIQAEEAQRRAAREEALARIPPDAYDIPLEVLALDDQVRDYLRKAHIESLGQIMERLADGDAALLILEGIDPETLAEIKSQVEMLVTVPAAAPRARDTAAPRLPRYEYVADEELEERIKPKRQKKKKRRQVLDADADTDDATSRQRRRSSPDDWDAPDE